MIEKINKNPSTFPITGKGKRQLEEELNKLLSMEQPKVLQAIEEALSHGDLKENAEYHSAKEKLAHISARIDYVKSTIASSTVIEPSTIKVEHVAFGATVTLIHLDLNKSVTYQIVGPDEANAENNKISINSPVARAIIGKKEGIEVTVKTGTKTIQYEIDKIEYI